MSTAVTDQEQAPLDLAEGERLLAAASKYWMRAYSDNDTSIAIKEFSKYEVGRYVAILLGRDGEPESELEYREANAAVIVWLRNNGEALVTALKARDERYQELLELARRESTWRDAIDEVLKLRDDLARVEADAKKWQEEAEQIHREDTELESRYEAALARIADLEVAVDMTPDYLGRTKLVYATEVIGLRKDLATERNRIAELEGSLRETADELARCNPDDPLYKSHAEERARAVLEPQTPSAS